MNFIDKLILLTFPFMDVGFVLFGVPIRLGELSFFLFFLRLINLNPILKITKIHKIGFLILLLLFINLILTISVGYFSEVNNSFFLKYILRNTIYFLAFGSFIIKPLSFNHIKIDFFIKYILGVVTFFYVLEFIDYYIVGFGLDSVFVSRQGKKVFYDFIIRFFGPSSEGAYIIPILSITLMYGLLKRNWVYSFLSLFLMVLPLSSFGYIVIFISIIYFIKKIESKEVKRKVRNFLVKGFFTVAILSLFFTKKIGEILFYNWTKFQAYFKVGNVTEWSASQRTGHIELALNLFMESSWFRMLVGSGTGYYSKMSKEFTGYYLDDGDEAHSLYVSTLLDRGIIGFILLLLLFYAISKIKIPKYVFGDIKYFFIAIKFGVFIRMFHWIFTGMIWQYYFWVEVSVLLSASAYYIKKSYEKK